MLAETAADRAFDSIGRVIGGNDNGKYGFVRVRGNKVGFGEVGKPGDKRKEKCKGKQKPEKARTPRPERNLLPREAEKIKQEMESGQMEKRTGPLVEWVD
jgi:hypothetical protein